MFNLALAKTEVNENIYIIKLMQLKQFLKMHFLEWQIGFRYTLSLSSSDVQTLL